MAVTAAALQWDPLVTRSRGFLALYPYAVLAAGVLLAWRFQRGRVFLALAVLAAATLGLGTAPGTVSVIAVLLPVNLIAIAVVRERGLVTRVGLSRAAFVVAQVGAVAFLVKLDSASGLLSITLLPTAAGAWTPVGDLGLLAFVAAWTGLTVGTALDPSPVTRGILWASVAAFCALHTIPTTPGGDATFVQPMTYFATAGLVLVVATIESSYSMAYRDGLTGLPSRRSLDEALERLSGHYTIAMVDVDHFKRLNDRHGHDVGDQVLRMVARTLGATGGGGRAFRYGGEEFAVLFRGKALDESLPYLERLRAAVENQEFTVRQADRPKRRPRRPRRRRGAERLGVTVSVGVAQRNGTVADPSEVVRAADAALYKAKRGGRNRVRS